MPAYDRTDPAKRSAPPKFGENYLGPMIYRLPRSIIIDGDGCFRHHESHAAALRSIRVDLYGKISSQSSTATFFSISFAVYLRLINHQTASAAAATQRNPKPDRWSSLRSHQKSGKRTTLLGLQQPT